MYFLYEILRKGKRKHYIISCINTQSAFVSCMYKYRICTYGIGRTQILNSMDIGLYSVFGQYDRKLLEEYDLFALDGSMGGGQLNLAKICDNLESYMKPVLKQNSQKLELHQSGLTGYRLLTDECGEVFYQQIVQYMQETLGSQGYSSFSTKCLIEREKQKRRI